MINYNNSDVVQCLRQYDMFANSLRLIKTNEEKGMIIRQLTKLEGRIIALTNGIYEEQYNALANKECGLLDDEKNRITMLIDLINQRLAYVEKRCNSHYQLTGESIDAPAVVGADMLESLENKVRIIDKYSKNIKLEQELQEEVKSLSSKISFASEKMDINKSLNVELEATFKKVLSEAFEELHLYELNDSKSDIEYAYYETEKSLSLAEQNLETAKTSPANILSDCEEMLTEVKDDYIKYKDQISILRLMEIYDSDVEDYEQLLNKRKEINEILKYIKNEALLDMIMDTVTKQYNTILMEQQDINTLNDLVLEKERKMNALSEINTENNSEEFQSVLKVLIENERKKQEKILEEQRKIEEIEKKKRLEIERKKQEEILKRQRIIENARKKEIEKRTKQLLEEQQNSVLQGKKKETGMDFDSMKDIATSKEEPEEVKVVEEKTEEIPEMPIPVKEPIITFGSKHDEEESEKEELPIFKDKIDIEKELFEEFNSSKKDTLKEEEVKEEIPEEDVLESDEELPVVENIMQEGTLFDKLEDKVSNNKLPEVSFDEYMKNFDESTVDKTENLFDDTDFPSIPM